MNAATALSRRRLPIGIQTFADLRNTGCYYVDKTGLAIDLIESAGKAFFLSRPRRFGKSLLVDTFKELFEGNRALFDGLAAETRWDWSKRHPVIRISFGGGVLRSRGELDQRMAELTDEHAARLGLMLHHQSLRRESNHAKQRRKLNGDTVSLLVCSDLITHCQTYFPVRRDVNIMLGRLVAIILYTLRQ